MGSMNDPMESRLQHIYDDLDKHGKLPQSDLRKMLKGHVCLVGTTDPLDLAKYLGIDEPYSDSTLVIGVPGNKIFWILIVQLDIGASEDEQLRNSGWSSTANDAMIEDVYHFKTPKGKLGELIDETSKKHISELLPSAVNALQDTVVPENCLYDLIPLSYEGIQDVLCAYRTQRYPYVKTQYDSSHVSAMPKYGH
ncbi:hypothetical protein BGZ58_008505, partial [Dissophora ornata]